MAVGLLIGTEHLDDFDGYIKTIEAVGKIFDKFKSHFGTVKCFEIQEKILSRHYDFWKTEDVQAWYKEGGLDACPGVCAIAARIGAEVIPFCTPITITLGFKIKLLHPSATQCALPNLHKISVRSASSIVIINNSNNNYG